jgi:large subunit ribosomal protein L17
MRHLKHGRKLGRVRNQRKALFRTMLGSFIIKEKIKTTEAKGKELKSKIDRIVNKAKKTKEGKNAVAVYRDLKKFIPDMAVKKLTGEFIDKFGDRVSGYSRITKLARRKTDGARMVIVEFV